MANDDLLVLKGGSTAAESDGGIGGGGGLEAAGWEPLDSYEAPYREPVLPPPDFDPDTLEIGVGVPIEEILRQRAVAPSRTIAPKKLSSPTPTPKLAAPSPTPTPLPSAALEFVNREIEERLKPFKVEGEGGV